VLQGKKAMGKSRILGWVNKRHRIRYNPELLPQPKLDLDEIDKFLTQDIFVQELSSRK